MTRNGADVQWDSFDNIASFSPATGITMQSLTGQQIMLNMVTIEPGAVVPIHSHANEQAGYVLRGELMLTIGDETRTLVPGDCYVAPANVPHGATTGAGGCEVLDVFSPPRADYAEAAARARSAN